MKLEMKDVDRNFYETELLDFLPDTFIDVHSHIYLKEFFNGGAAPRATTWPSKIAEDCSIEDLRHTYELLFPGKNVIPVLFGQPGRDYDIQRCNDYVKKSSEKYQYPSLMLSSPDMETNELETNIRSGGFRGVKVYLNYSPAYIPDPEIRIFDFLPHEHLKMLDRNNWIVMLHIPRPGRLKDPVNLAQLIEIEEKYPNIKLIVAHVGRAYAEEDVGDAFKILSQTQNMYFDFSANVNTKVFEGIISAVGPKRIMFGTDFPIFRMRGARIVENGFYINLIPRGLYGDVSGEPHMRELDGEDAEKLTFIIYEEIAAFKAAAKKTGLTKTDIENVFCKNAASLFGVK